MRILIGLIVLLIILLVFYTNNLLLLWLIPLGLIFNLNKITAGDERTVRNFAEMNVVFKDPITININDDEFFEWVKNDDNPNLIARFINSTSSDKLLSQILMENILGDGFRIYDKHIYLTSDYTLDTTKQNSMNQIDINNIREGVIRFSTPDHAMSIVIKDKIINIYEPNADLGADTLLKNEFNILFEKQIKSGYKIKTLVDGVCSVKFQSLGGSGLCQTYALFIVALRIYNPSIDFNIIEKYYNDNIFNIQDAIMKFLYYIHKHIIPKMKNHISTKHANYSNYVTGLYHPIINVQDTIEYKNITYVLNLYDIAYEIPPYITRNTFDVVKILNKEFVNLVESTNNNKGSFMKILYENQLITDPPTDDDYNDFCYIFRVCCGQMFLDESELTHLRLLRYRIDNIREKIDEMYKQLDVNLDDEERIKLLKIILNNFNEISNIEKEMLKELLRYA
jgi:hypothetical protein